MGTRSWPPTKSPYTENSGVVKKQLFESGEPVHAGFRLIYSCSSVPVRDNPDEVHVNWYLGWQRASEVKPRESK